MDKSGKSLINLQLLIVTSAMMCAGIAIAGGYIAVSLAHSTAIFVTGSVVAAAFFSEFLLIFNACKLYRRIKKQQISYADAENHYFNVLCEVMMVVEARDKFLAGRSRRMAAHVAQIAAQMKLDSEYSRLLGMIARVHDIGLLSVPAEIMGKAGQLTASEYSIIKRHCRVGCHILQQLKFLHPVLDAVLYHHEKLNGTGYPEGLKGDDIPIGARILAVADSYDAMTHDRPHRNALMPEQAIDELIRCSGPGYDRNVVAAMAAAQKMTDRLPAEWLDAAESEDKTVSEAH